MLVISVIFAKYKKQKKESSHHDLDGEPLKSRGAAGIRRHLHAESSHHVGTQVTGWGRGVTRDSSLHYWQNC